MRPFQFAPWALAAMLAVALPSTHSARAAAGTSAQAVKMLDAQLPPGVTLSKANIATTAKALHDAIVSTPDMALPLTQTAVLAKTPKQGHGELPCESLLKLIRAAVNARPQKSSDITQLALSLHPECADELNTLINNGTDGFDTPGDLYGGFGVGFGPGFPGSPGFVGSPPSGAIALPPTAVTPPDNT